MAGPLSLLLALIACQQRSQEPKKPSARNVYVVAKSAPLRARAEPRAVLIAELPIGTKLTVERVAGDWCAVQAGESKSGFVETRLLANDEPTPAMLRKQFFATPKVDVATRRMWVEREVALSPSDVDVLERFVATLRDAGDEEALDEATARLEAVRPASSVAKGGPPPILVGTQGCLLDHEDAAPPPEAGVPLKLFGVGIKAIGLTGPPAKVIHPADDTIVVECRKANVTRGMAPEAFLAVSGNVAEAVRSQETPKRMNHAHEWALTTSIAADLRAAIGDFYEKRRPTCATTLTERLQRAPLTKTVDHTVLSVGERAFAFFAIRLASYDEAEASTACGLKGLDGERLVVADLANDRTAILYERFAQTDHNPAAVHRPAPLWTLAAVADIGADGKVEVLVRTPGLLLYQLDGSVWRRVRTAL